MEVEEARHRASRTSSRKCNRRRTWTSLNFKQTTLEERASHADPLSLNGVEAHRVEECYNKPRRAVCLKYRTKLNEAQVVEEGL